MTKKLIAALVVPAMIAAALPPAALAAGKAPVFETDFESEKGLILKDGAELRDGKSGKGLFLDGADDYAILPKNIISDEMTISAWVKQDRKNVWGRLFDLGEDSNENFFFAPCSGSASRVEAKSKAGVVSMDAEEFESTGVWAYYTVTADKNSFKLYRDGRLMSEKSAGGMKLSDIKNTLNYIGKSHYDGDAFFAGMVDDLKIYDRVLGADEILSDMAENFDYNDKKEVVTVYTADFKDGQIIFGDSIDLPYVKIGNEELIWTASPQGVIDTATGKITQADAAAEVTLSAGFGNKDTQVTSFDNLNYKVKIPPKSIPPFTVSVNAADRSKDISDDMWGLFFEDINSAADGGLYAELVQNGSFEYPENMYSWTVVDGTAEVKTEGGMNGNNPSYVSVSGGAVSNDGYMGMYVEEGKSYDVSLWAKGSAVMVAQLADENGTVMSSAKLDLLKGHEAEGNNPEWTKLTAVLKADKTTENARLMIAVNGTADIDVVSLMPQDTYKGHGLRRDFCEALEEMQPKFLRFPGGCAVEGRTMDLAYNWKDTVGDLSERKMMENIWNTSSEPYIMSYGLGFYEYFQLCEDMDMEPVPILNCGLACQVRSGGKTDAAHVVQMGELQPYIDDAIDLVAFANGTDMSNKWVKLRSDMGHPEPFGLKYLGIGNEQFDTIYFERYEAFAKALREAYPDMGLELVSTSGPSSSGSMNDLAWSWTDGHNELVDVVDEHYYENPDWFRTHAYRYDNYGRDTAKVFLGEYASKGNTWYNALSEAAFMTGLERNADVVRMASYAPMFAKFGNTQWTAANMLWFNNSDFVKTPNYYVQKLFATNSGDYSLPTDVRLTGTDDLRLHGGVLLGAWNTQTEYKDVRLTAADGTEIEGADLSNWEVKDGTWEIDGNTVKQSELKERCALYLDKDLSDYTLTMKARRTGGWEGFQIGVACEDHKNYYRINMGGWTNTVTKLQKVVDGTAEIVSNYAEGNINTDVHVKENEWQDVKVVVTGDTISAYLDGVLACSFTKPADYGPVYASTAYDAATGDTILKLVNTVTADVNVNVNITGAGYIEPNAAVTVMSGDSGAENTLENKNNIVPRESAITNAANTFVYKAPANSLSVIRLKSKSLTLLGEGKAEFYDYSGAKHELDLEYDGAGVLTGVAMR